MAFIKRITEAELAKELREHYIQNPPEGMTSNEVRDISDDDLLDMDYFLHEFNDCDDRPIMQNTEGNSYPRYNHASSF